MRRFGKIFLVCIGLSCSAMSFADTVSSDANTTTAVSVVVPDQSAASLQTGLQAAFSQWMMQTSHDPQIMTQPAVQNASKNVMQWVQSYQYVSQAAGDSSTQPATLLQVVFDQTATQSLINSPAKTVTQNTAQAVPENIAAPLQMTVSDIRNMQDYTEALHALREKPDVKNVVASEINSNQVKFEITLAGNPDHFLQNLSSDYRFRAAANDSQPAGMATQTKQFSWTGNPTS